MKAGLQSQYNDILNGTKSTLTIIPPRFQHSKDMTLSIKGLEERIKAEKEKKATSQYNEAEIN
jgi:hypothetical protein